MNAGILLLAFLGGMLPALVWLFFWLLEDRCEPEPKRYIFFTFLAGMVAVLVALPLERAAAGYLSGGALLFCWAICEELLKFAAAYFAALRFRVFDEPLDAVIYLVTAALGFSALENALFLWTPLQQGDLLRTIVTGDLRFMGATLLHTLASATIGLALAWSFHKEVDVRRMFALVGVVLAITLHTLFNFFILQQGSSATFWIFLCIWFGIIAALLMIERVKQPTKDYC
ncbi:MAG: PrsW family glutamic-type intramembrane protease [Candidatus Adlerbacteria bacterium]|nr:PrsW family glutamic-type intramembrane protease [Candidatus Adlerbacteria bacterium]